MDKKFAVCALSCVPIRREFRDASEMVSQMLFGDTCECLSVSENQKWVFVRTTFDAYEGWVDAKQLIEVEEAYVLKLLESPYVYVKSLYGLVKSETKFIPLLMGSRLPFYKNGILAIGDEPLIFEGEYGVTQPFDANALEKVAYLYMGAPYLWGGKSPFGIDCSGYMQQLFRMFGVALPRDAYQQEQLGILVPFEYTQPGDLAFFKNPEGRIVHVGLVLKGNKIIHASGQVRIDVLDETGIIHSEQKIYTHRLASIKRMHT